MKPFNQTTEAALLLTENSRINEVFVYKVDNVATDISGGAFKWNLLDKKGGTILSTITIGYTSDGTDGSVTFTYEIATLTAILTAYDAGTGSLPGFHELFFSSDGTAAKYKIWVYGDVEVDRTGSA